MICKITCLYQRVAHYQSRLYSHEDIAVNRSTKARYGYTHTETVPQKKARST